MTSRFPHYTRVLDAAKADLSAIRSNPKALESSDFLAYLQLKATVPAERRADLRDAFLKFQDRDMMDEFISAYL